VGSRGCARVVAGEVDVEVLAAGEVTSKYSPAARCSVSASGAALEVGEVDGVHALEVLGAPAMLGGVLEGA
jgi:hypothetical protein